MKDSKFKQLILDVYTEWNKPERTFKKEILNAEITYNNFWGTLYSAMSSPTFMDIKDIKGYVDITMIDMLLLNSRVTGQEIEIYEWQLRDYKIEGDKLVLQLEDKEKVFEM